MERQDVKNIVVSLSSLFVGSTVIIALKNVVPAQTKMQIISRWIGTTIISGMVSYYSQNYVEKSFDECAELYDNLRGIVKEEEN